MVSFGNVEMAAKVADRLGSKNLKSCGGRMSFIMDVSAADGVNGNSKIDFDAMLAADEFNFLHDALGIVRHMNRETGKLEDFFRPRFAR